MAETVPWGEIVGSESERRRARRRGKPPLRCRVFGHRWMGPWAMSDHRPWCVRCGLLGVRHA